MYRCLLKTEPDLLAKSSCENLFCKKEVYCPPEENRETGCVSVRMLNQHTAKVSERVDREERPLVAGRSNWGHQQTPRITQGTVLVTMAFVPRIPGLEDDSVTL